MKNVKTFDEFVNESVNEAISERIYMSLTKIVNYLKEVKKLYPDVMAMVPLGWVGHSSTEVNLDDAIKILTEHDRDHKRKKDPVQFYIWHIDVKNLRNSTERDKLVRDGIKGLRSFDKKYSRQFDNSPYITRINISMNSDSITQFGNDMSAGKYGSLD